MISIEPGTVEKVIWSRNALQCLQVSLRNKKEKAFNYSFLTGPALPGDKVGLNTTAVKLGLGSGGYHFVIFNHAHEKISMSQDGHIIKLRYTPLQLKVQVYEEIWGQKQSSAALQKYAGLANTPVVIGELHSMLAPFVLTLKKLNPERKIVYIMTDSAALPIYMSNIVHQLQKNKLLDGTITCCQAFGGDLETVNIYTALIAAREELSAELIIITPGPGVVGTGTRYGYSGIEQGEHIDRVHRMQGIPVVIPRISFADSRPRHYGLSHHTLTALDEIASQKAFLPVPIFDSKKTFYIFNQLKKAGIMKKHRVVFIKQHFLNFLRTLPYNLQTMGRKIDDDPAFFAAATAAAYFVEKIKMIGNTAKNSS